MTGTNWLYVACVICLTLISGGCLAVLVLRPDSPQMVTIAGVVQTCVSAIFYLLKSPLPLQNPKT